MSTYSTILKTDAGSKVNVRVPVPKKLRGGKLRVTVTLEPVKQSKDPDDMTLLEVFEELRKLGGLKDIIPDPVAWQREQRKDRPLPGRE